MRVLHAVTLHTPSHAFGGPTRVALGLCRGLAERGERATLVALGDEFPAGPLPRAVEGARVRLFRARHVLPRFEVSGITSPALLARALGYVRSADVVHVHLMRDLVTLPVALLALRAGTPLVLQTHGMVDPTENRVARLVDRLGVRRVLRRADAVLYLTESERRETAAVVAPAPIAPAHRLVNGVPARERAPAPAGPPRLLYLARVQAGKRPGDFVGAMPTVLARHPDARFVLAGPDTGALAETLALADELGVRGALDVVGALDGPEVLAALRSAHALVLPSTRDAFPLSVLEAMSVGTPVVVTGTNGLAADVAGAGAGRVVPARAEANGPAVGRAVLELLDPAAREAASEAAWTLARDAFTLDTVVDRLAGIYEQVLAARRPRRG
ncbi:glycosyltransferase [Streptomyces triticirhizae]|uniref:D-inositol 3-phosphate glycosyltransferase n=1 Tax=Streptomyces triticirhizae TaxID=2483353 RepID=A0A3M2L668_9ACTN|nr:glycosyltransferase [Streptomyces triticirhizae]RMI33202.1 glycosyltransferase [Streptomyces triticirhizae]